MASASPALVTVLIPATSANLGPGFDVLGLAIQLYNRFEVEEVGDIEHESLSDPRMISQDLSSSPLAETSQNSAPQCPHIQVQGSLGVSLPSGPDNLFFRTFALLFQHQQVELPAVNIRMSINIPPGSGLGSSATAVVGGLIAANEFLRMRGLALTKEELLELAVEAEVGNHPDNVAPALLGGLVAITSCHGRIRAVKMYFPDALKVVIFTPSFQMDTVLGRKLLPDTYSKADVIFTTGRLALLLAALQMERYELIGEAMQDRLHQPYRQTLFPAMPDIIEAAITAGAHGAYLSGAGSSLIALASSNFHAILKAMQETAHSSGVEGTGMILSVDQIGARVLYSSHANHVNRSFN